MGPDVLFLIAVAGLTLLLLTLRTDIAVLSLIALANWHIGGQFVADVSESFVRAPWYAYAAIELGLRLGVVLIAIVLLRRKAKGGVATRFALAIFLSAVLVLFVSQILSVYPQTSFASSFISRLLLQFSDWLQAGLLVVAFFRYAETSHLSRKRSRR